VAKAELGTKRICPNCGTKYYDLNRDPIVCPRCGTHFEAAARVRPAAVAEDEEEIELDADTKAEFIPLEEADQEEADTGAVVVEGDEDEIAADDEDDTFLEPDEDEEGDDVTKIIGDVDEEEP
jgi:uncharacterized protein (TIGR02300 family)